MKLLRYVVVMLSVTASCWAQQLSTVKMTSVPTTKSLLFGWPDFELTPETHTQHWSATNDFSGLKALSFIGADGAMPHNGNAPRTKRVRIVGLTEKERLSLGKYTKQANVNTKYFLEQQATVAGLKCVAAGLSTTLYAAITVSKIGQLFAKNPNYLLDNMEKPSLLNIGMDLWTVSSGVYTTWALHDRFKADQRKAHSAQPLTKKQREIILGTTTKTTEDQVLYGVLEEDPSSAKDWEPLPTSAPSDSFSSDGLTQRISDSDIKALTSEEARRSEERARFLRHHQCSYFSQEELGSFIFNDKQKNIVFERARLALSNSNYPHSYRDNIFSSTVLTVNNAVPNADRDNTIFSSTVLAVNNAVHSADKTYKPEGLYTYLSKHWTKGVDGQGGKLFAWDDGLVTTSLKPAVFAGAAHLFAKNMSSLPPFMYDAKTILTSGWALGHIAEGSVVGAKIGVAGAKKMNKWLQKPWPWQVQNGPALLQQTEQAGQNG